MMTAKQLVIEPRFDADEADIYEDIIDFCDDIEFKHLAFGDKLLSLRGANRFHSDLDFKVWKLGAWSTTRINALELMNPEQIKYWLEE